MYEDKTHGQIHKYWDSETIHIFLALKTTMMRFNLSVFSFKSGERSLKKVGGILYRQMIGIPTPLT